MKIYYHDEYDTLFVLVEMNHLPPKLFVLEDKTGHITDDCYWAPTLWETDEDSLWDNRFEFIGEL